MRMNTPAIKAPPPLLVRNLIARFRRVHNVQLVLTRAEREWVERMLEAQSAEIPEEVPA